MLHTKTNREKYDMSENNDRMRALTHDRIADQFDNLINQYDLQRRLEVLLYEFLSPDELMDKFVLDAGCGTGRGTQRLADNGANVVSFDLGIRLVEYTRQRYPCVPVSGSINIIILKPKNCIKLNAFL